MHTYDLVFLKRVSKKIRIRRTRNEYNRLQRIANKVGPVVYSL